MKKNKAIKAIIEKYRKSKSGSNALNIKKKEQKDNYKTKDSNFSIDKQDKETDIKQEDLEQEPTQESKDSEKSKESKDSEKSKEIINPAPASKTENSLNELGEFKSQLNSEILKQNKSIDRIEDLLENIEQRVFHSQDAERTSRQDKDNNDNPEPEKSSGFNLNLKEKMSFLSQKVENTYESSWLLPVAAVVKTGIDYFFGEDSNSDTTKANNPKVLSDNDKLKIEQYKNQTSDKANSSLDSNSKEQKQKELLELAENRRKKLSQKQIKPSKEYHLDLSSDGVISSKEDLYNYLNDPDVDIENKQKWKNIIRKKAQAQLNQISLLSSSTDPKDIKEVQRAQTTLNNLKESTEGIINIDFNNPMDISLEEQKRDTEEKFKNIELTEKSQESKGIVSKIKGFFGIDPKEKIDSELKKDITNKDLSQVEFNHVYNKLKEKQNLDQSELDFLEQQKEEYNKKFRRDKKVKTLEQKGRYKELADLYANEDTSKGSSMDSSPEIEKLNEITKQQEETTKNLNQIEQIKDNKNQDIKELVKQDKSTGVTETHSSQDITRPETTEATEIKQKDKDKEKTSSPAVSNSGESSSVSSDQVSSLASTEETPKEQKDISFGESSSSNFTKPSNKVKLDKDNQELSKMTTPGKVKDIINNNEINNSSIQTITPETDNFKKFEVANLNNNYKNILGV